MSRPKKTSNVVTKICEECKKEFIIPFKKRHQKFCNKLCAQKNPLIKEKIKISQTKTFTKKYGSHPMKKKETLDNFKKSMIEKYGVDSALKNKDLLNKHKETCLRKYGKENFNNRDKYKETCLKKYGVESYIFTDDYKNKTKETCLKKYGKECYYKSNNFKQVHYDLMFEKFKFGEDFKNFTPLFLKEEYQGVLTSYNQSYKFQCNRCNNIDLYNLSNGKRPVCINCDKLNSSKEQKEIYDFLKEILGNDELILMNEKTILYPKEIDIYLPNYKTAIEYNSLYWHSELSGHKNKTYHLNKTKSCVSKDLKLIHIFQTEWVNKKEIVMSILRNSLNKNKNKYYARECKIMTVNKKDSDKFLLNNHIQGPDNSSIKIGLYFNDILVSLMTFGKSRYDKKYEYEMYRFCNILNTTVIGGASKLFSHFTKTYNPTSVVSYSDRKYFDGDLYLTLNFKFILNTVPNYFYITDCYKNLKSRIAFQKHKLSKILENFDPNLTEWENMKLHGFDRIWDCGNSKWVFKQS